MASIEFKGALTGSPVEVVIRGSSRTITGHIVQAEKAAAARGYRIGWTIRHVREWRGVARPSG
jgi:hypothetical protein